jgi:EpsI family protein
MACTAVLVIEMWLLSKVGRNRAPFSEVFAVDPPAAISSSAQGMDRSLPSSYYVLFFLLITTAVVSKLLPERNEIIPDRVSFESFPLKIGEWEGKQNELESIYLESLKLTDYVLANYTDEGNQVEFYVAYYGSQRKGVSAHSPRSCLPGGGWRIKDLRQVAVEGVMVARTPLVVNRVVIQQGEVKQLVYYWFQQRGRIITDEYFVKWYLLWDALTKQRTDGALVRVTAIVPQGRDISETDRLLNRFIGDVSKEIDKYIPQ